MGNEWRKPCPHCGEKPKPKANEWGWNLHKDACAKKKGKGGKPAPKKEEAPPKGEKPPQGDPAVSLPCPNCDGPVFEEDKFCRGCGVKITGWSLD